MSRVEDEILRIRLREEFDRLDLSLAGAARLIGDTDSLSLRDVCAGRKRTTADLLARLAKIGIDVLYVVTGQRTPESSHALSTEESTLLDNYRHADDADKATARRVLFALSEQKAA